MEMTAGQVDGGEDETAATDLSGDDVQVERPAVALGHHLVPPRRQRGLRRPAPAHTKPPRGGWGRASASL